MLVNTSTCKQVGNGSFTLCLCWLGLLAFAQKHDGISNNLSNLFKLSDAKTRSISPENFGGEKGKKYKYKPLNQLLLSINQISLQEQKKVLDTTFNNWQGNLEQVDDVLIVGIKI